MYLAVKLYLQVSIELKTTAQGTLPLVGGRRRAPTKLVGEPGEGSVHYRCVG